MEEQKEEKQPIIFGYYVNDELKGFRADSFGTLSKKFPKIYTYSKEQVDIIKKNTEQELSNSGTTFMKTLFNMGGIPMNMEGNVLDENAVIDQISKGEQEKRSWGEFELRIIPFIDINEFYDMCFPGEEYKRDALFENLKEPLEIYKFKTLQNEN